MTPRPAANRSASSSTTPSPVVLVSGALAALALPVFGAVDSGPGTTFVPVLLAAAYVLFNRFFDLTATLLRGVGRFSFEAILQSVGAVAFIAGSIAVTAAGLGVSAVLAVLCAKEAVSGAVSYVALREDLGHRRPASERGGWRRLFGIGIRLSIAGIALALVMRVPLALLGNLGSSQEVALFSAAQRFGDAAYILAISLGVALLPGSRTWRTRICHAPGHSSIACCWPSPGRACCSRRPPCPWPNRSCT